MSRFRTVVVFAAAGWGVRRARAWWRPLAITGAIVGAAVLPVWWIAVSSISGVTSVAANLALHAAGIAVLLAVLLVPSLTRRLDRRLTTHLGGLA
jgi:hypothetical protein